MGVERLNARRVETARAEGKLLELRDADTTGLELRVMPGETGIKTWSFSYTRASDKKRRRSPIGHYPAIGLEEARKRAAVLRRAVDDGGDPAGERQAERQADTFNDLADAWLKRHVDVNLSKARAYDARLMLDKDVRPVLGAMLADSVTGRDVRRVLDGVLDRGAVVRANRVLSVVRAIYAWGRGQHRTAIDPTAGMAKPSKERPRDRVLSEAEVAAFWRGLDDAKMSQGLRLAYRLLLLTAQRESAMAEAAKAEFDLEARIWTIPRERTKSKIDEHRVPLCSAAVDLLKAAFELSGKSRWLFPSPRADKPIDGHALNRAMQRARAAGAFGEANFTTHDLRRTAATLMGDLGFDDFTIGHVLDHSQRGTITGRVYNKGKYDPQKRTALDALGQRVEEIIGLRQPATNVVPLVHRATA